MPRICLAVTVMLLCACGRIGYSPSSNRDTNSAPDSGSIDSSVPTARCGDGVLEGVERCDDGNNLGGDGCAPDCASVELCGDGVVSGAEECDDGNSVRGDGCENDCAWSCESADECDDADPCSGTESCAGTHICEPGEALADGIECSTDRACRSGACVLATCGDGMINPGEDCDDENLIDSDGCGNDCLWTCRTGADCSDSDTCNGIETCADDHTCQEGAAAAEGAECERDGVLETVDLCLAGSCARSRCGDGYTFSPSEDCDDSNLENGDGCDNDCSFSCDADMVCNDGAECNGIETCDPGLHLCAPGLPLPSGTPCAGGQCSAGACMTIADSGMDGGADAGTDVVTDTGIDITVGAMMCVRDTDCASGSKCCDTCPGFPRRCWFGIVCPSVLCGFDAGL